MNIETTITHAWQTQAKWLYLLSPLSWLYAAVTQCRKALYDKGILASYRADVPVMVIGNITVGGSGKTPLIINLVNYLQSKGVKVGVISRGYGGDSTQMPAMVNYNSTPDVVGDEPCLIVQSTGVSMSVCPNRQQAIELLLQHEPDIQLIISDDGLQHYKLARDIEWIVVDSHRGFGNEQVLPVGFLREPMSRLDGATVVYHQLPQSDIQSNNQQLNNQLVMQLQPAQLEPLLSVDGVALATQQPQSFHPFQPQSGDEVIAMSGIGYPARFFATLTSLGYQVIEKPLPDHHDFSFDDLYPLMDSNLPIIVTSKDAVKLRQLANADLSQLAEKADQHLANLAQVFTRIWVLPVSAELNDACYQSLDESLKQFNITH